MKWYEIELNAVLQKLGADAEQGLTQEAADERFAEYGANVFEEEKKESLPAKILHHMKDVSTIILLIAAGISAYMAISTGYGWPKIFVILSIIIINIVLGISQESKAEKALDALKGMNTHTATVVRGGTLMHLNAEELVPGDVVELHAGDMVPADARLISSNSLLVEESALTGESLPVEKDAGAVIPRDAPLGDRINMVYSGCLVTNGRAKSVVCETGMQTEMGKIAGLLNNTKKQMTPLQIRLKGLAKRLSLVAIASGLVIFAVGVFVHGESLAEMLLTAISLAVAAVPETLPVIVTLILANGVQYMVRKNTIIRRIPAVETVGNTSVICSDKTGTLTQNKMVIKKIWETGSDPKNSGSTFSPAEQTMLELLAVCTNAVPKENEISSAGEPVIIGDPTEAAIIRLMMDKGLDKPSLEKKYPRVFELPFDSTRKLMTTVHKTDTGYISVTKGAFDRIPVSFDDVLHSRAVKAHDEFAGQALRVIAVAVKNWEALPAKMDTDTLEHDLTFCGIIGMIDPPRPESHRAVMYAKKAGIKTVMITGDHIATASAIARDIGILEENGRAVTGTQLSGMDDRELHEAVRNISVYARVSPEDKIRIVQAWQAHGEVITMTGDGVNDAPALKAADVGAAMGIAGTDVSKNASDIIITDDNFATIVDAVREGRTAYDNIRKTVHFLLSVNFAEILIMLIGVLLGWGAPITAVQLLFINVVSDGIPGFFISRERAEKDLMLRRPLPKNASLFAGGLGWQIAGKSAVFIVLTLAAFYIGRFVSVSSGTAAGYGTGISMAFLVLSWASVLNIFNIRGRESVFKTGLFINPWLTVSAAASIAITALVALIRPLQVLFGISPLGPVHWLIAGGLSFSQLLFGEVVKLFQKNAERAAG
ncbi:cation-translocating P-type ATPase [Breznakiella homolactica]|uniref:Cation-translocating P-type ATPase n=1 Tax=Breznakiella homolactica TaxID=2798577 RepID=A0A7T8BA15_9SPIR|nr:cation-translocating P-type ATPase [Breznakiella homolactica]QQO07758.1 cation-translocating P-type ATPase [Breznakiella homolactica]